MITNARTPLVYCINILDHLSKNNKVKKIMKIHCIQQGLGQYDIRRAANLMACPFGQTKETKVAHLVPVLGGLQLGELCPF